MKPLEQSLWTKEDVSMATKGLPSGMMSNGWLAKGVSIDSRTCLPGDMFIALSGTNFDGHNSSLTVRNHLNYANYAETW